MEKEGAKEETQQVLKVLEALKQASHEIQCNPSPDSPGSNSSSAIKALLELETESDSILSYDPHLSNLSHHLTNLRILINSLQKSRSHHGLRSFLTRRIITLDISRVAGSIESEIQSWIHRETIINLIRALQLQQSICSSCSLSSVEEDKFLDSIDQFRIRLKQGFSNEFQDLILKSKVFSKLESVLCRSNFSKRVREKAAFVIVELVKFNKDVFVGQVLMGQTVRALMSMGSLSSLQILYSLIKSIKSPLVDDIEENGETQKIISFLSSDDLLVRIMAMDCVLEIGYFGRREAVEEMMNVGLIKKLVELQRSELGGDLIDLDKVGEEGENRGVEVGEWERNGRWGRRENGERRLLESHPFASCVGRFAVALEVGEGLRRREKRWFKQEILTRVREASVSDAEAVTIIAEVLWGSSP
ncbi:unnamed protein product [Ilex paraguariensis]|uniref:Coatomer beta subunit n=1 Tax=Ilex paraguariensis TaxID=185542 RepID=A0ABC8SF93_9AQUA